MKHASHRGAIFRTAKLNSLLCIIFATALSSCGSAQSQSLLVDEQVADTLRTTLEKKNYPGAEQLLLTRIKQLENTPPKANPLMPNEHEWQLYYALSPLASVYCKEGKWSEAEATYKRLLAINEQIKGFVDETLKDLADCYIMQRKFSQAEPLLRRALEDDEKANARETSLAESTQHLAELLTIEGKDGEAERFYRRAFKYEMFKGGPFDPHLIPDFDVLVRLFKEEAQDVATKAQIKLHQEKDAAARETLGKLYLSDEVETSIKSVDTSHGGPDAALRYTLLAAVYAAEGKYKEAETLLHDALISTEYMEGPDFNGYMLTDQPEPKDPTFGDSNPDVAKRLDNIAELFMLEGKYAQAEAPLKRSLMITRTTMSENHPRVAMTMKLYAQVLRKTGKETEAEELNAKIKTLLAPQN